MTEPRARRARSSPERLIRNGAGLFLKDGRWTLDASEATVFPTTSAALRARMKLGLEDITLVPAAAQHNISLNSN